MLANSYTYGEEWKDNQYIQAKHYRQLLQITPKEVLALIDRKNVEKTLANLTAFRKEDKNKEDFKKIVKAYQTPEIAKLIEKTNDYPAWEGAK